MTNRQQVAIQPDSKKPKKNMISHKDPSEIIEGATPKNEEASAGEIEPLLMSEDIRSLLFCSETTRLKLHKDGKLRAKKIGRLVRYRPEDVRAYLASE